MSGFLPHPGQLQVLQRARRFNGVRCGRRFGKTKLGLFVALTGGHPGHERAIAQGFDVGWFAPNYKYLDEAWRGALEAFAPIGIVRKDSQLHRIEFRTGAALDFWTLEDEDAGRSRRYGTVIVDEAGLARKLLLIWEESIRPALTDFEGSGWFLSTPKGLNDFHTLCTRGDDGLRWPDWAHHHAPTSANPFIPAAEIEAARRSLPERVFAQEYLAEFLSDGAGVFRRVLDAIDDSLATRFEAAGPQDGASYVIGVDWGRSNDFTVVIVLDVQTGAVVVADRFTGLGYRVQRDRLAAIAQRFQGAPIVVERNNFGDVQAEELQRDAQLGQRVRTFTTSNASKAEAIESLALAFEQGAVRLPRLQWLIDELLAFDSERMASGMLRYSAPPGKHDDGVMALAIAWHGRSFGGSAWARKISYPSMGMRRGT